VKFGIIYFKVFLIEVKDNSVAEVWRCVVFINLIYWLVHAGSYFWLLSVRGKLKKLDIKTERRTCDTCTIMCLENNREST